MTARWIGPLVLVGVALSSYLPMADAPGQLSTSAGVCEHRLNWRQISTPEAEFHEKGDDLSWFPTVREFSCRFENVQDVDNYYFLRAACAADEIAVGGACLASISSVTTLLAEVVCCDDLTPGCAQDVDCAPIGWCYERTAKCHPKRFPGASCQRDSQCRSGGCRASGVCQ